MTVYAVAHLKNPNPHPRVREYMERVHETLHPFKGRFLVHGPVVEVREGDWPGTMPGHDAAELAAKLRLGVG